MKKFIITLILAATFLIPFGCSKASHGDSIAYSDSTTSWEGSGFSPEGAASVEGRVAFRDMSNLYGEVHVQQISEDTYSADMTSASIERKLVKKANIRIRVENLEAADTGISDLMKKYGAYAASTQIEENLYRYSLRVPSQRYDTFLSEMDSMGRILRRNETTEDVTTRYYDLEGRLATKRELLRTYQSYLGRANNIEEILSVEARIADLQYDIDITGTQLRNLANMVDYATIDLDLYGPVTSTPYKRTTLGERIKELFSGFGGFLSVIAIVITAIIIYGIPILLLLVLFYLVLFGRIGLLKKVWRIAGKKQE